MKERKVMDNTVDNVIEMRHIVKQFGNFRANDDINLTLKKGEILALLGENGAGKSTLMNILSGLLQPTSGDIYVNGKKVIIKDPNTAKRLKIGMVHQHFMLAESFSVLENIILGNEITKGCFIDFKKEKEKIIELSKQYGLAVNLGAKISQTTVSQQQRIEILKVLYRGADILIFDEPTAVLTPQEITEFIKVIKGLVHEGKSIIFITHKLKEIKEACDRVTVIRRGKSIGTIDTSATTDQQLADMMVGRKVNLNVTKPSSNIGDTILDVENLVVKDSRGVQIVKKLSLQVHRGEILGLAGIDGNGQDELVEALTGLRHVESGCIRIKGHDSTNQPVRKITQCGVAHVPADRQKYGLILSMSLADNLALQTYYEKPLSKHGFLQKNEMIKKAERLVNGFDIRAANLMIPAGDLSGGNQQKAIIARELDRNADLIIVFQPTRGLDVGAIEYIHEQLLKQREAGKAVLLVSYELDEILKLSDRIAVIHNGQISGTVLPADTNERELGLLMTGAVR